MTGARVSDEELWLAALANECEQETIDAVARRLGYSASVISQALQRKYVGNLVRLRAIVEGQLLGKVVDCPVIGEIPLDQCARFQTGKPANTNHFRTQFPRACRDCPNRLKQGDHNDSAT